LMKLDVGVHLKSNKVVDTCGNFTQLGRESITHRTRE
jgi:hypothetical protein